ncbi:hypothetical protein [Candidatus Nitrososphaera gargensis]|uniref:hypothetical protein n=1 Tax=Candidatus Nitrososphaera gargensis TaxID=497727 RepID=UPI00164F85AE|nr:hypothetical protein [Candidatus Nitrososphaera gargensis]
MPTSILVQIEIPTERNITDVTSEAVRDTIANLFPYDPRFDQLIKSGAKVEITLKQPLAEKAPVPAQPVKAESPKP